MKPEQLIAEVEALLPSGPDQVVTRFHKWRLLAPLVLDALKAMQDALERLTADLAAERSRCAMLESLRERDEANPSPQVIALKNEVERLTAERDAATKRAAEWEIQAQDFRDRVVKAEAEREELRASYGKLKALHAELAADVSLLRHPDHPKVVATHKEIAHALGLDERATADAVLTAIVIMRNQAQATLDMQARARHLENSATLARAELETLRSAQTPRPIEEAPRDGTWIVAIWPDVPEFTPELLRWAGSHGWDRKPTNGGHPLTHFFPLPVKP